VGGVVYFGFWMDFLVVCFFLVMLVVFFYFVMI